MTEQTPQDEAREEEKKRPVPRDAVRWVEFALATVRTLPRRYLAGGIARQGQRVGPRILLILQGAESIKCKGTGEA
jgi:hypothetical protein